LLFAGDQIPNAIENYRKNPNNHACFSTDFQQLLSDYYGKLRSWYLDPFTNHQKWGMIYDTQQHWVGIYIRGKGVPLKKSGFAARYDKYFTLKMRKAMLIGDSK